MTPLLAPLAHSIASFDAGLLLLAGCVAALSVLLARLAQAPRRR